MYFCFFQSRSFFFIDMRAISIIIAAAIILTDKLSTWSVMYKSNRFISK